MDKDVIVSRGTHLEQAGEVSTLRAENARLRAALQAILDDSRTPYYTTLVMYRRELQKQAYAALEGK